MQNEKKERTDAYSFPPFFSQHQLTGRVTETANSNTDTPGTPSTPLPSRWKSELCLLPAGSFGGAKRPLDFVGL